MKKYIAGIDMGTGGSRCVIFDLQGHIAGQAYREMPTLFTQPGWMEMDPHQMIESTYDAVREAVAASGVNPDDIAALSFSSFQASFACIDRAGEYLGNFIVWQDIRGTQMFPWMLERLAENGLDQAELYRRCGQPMNIIPSGPRVLWLKEHTPEFYEKVWKFVTPQAMMVHAFGGEDWYDESCNGSIWMVQSCDDYAIDPELVRIFGVDPDKYPRIATPGTPVGQVTAAVAARTGLRAGTPLFVGAADQMCAALGVGNYGTPDIGHLALGTAGILLAWSPTAARDPQQTYHIIGFPGGGYSLEAAAAVAALALRWLRDLLYPAEAYDPKGIFDRMTAEAQASAIGANGVVFLPHLVGSLCPTNDATMRGTFAGMGPATTRGDLVRATMEGVCYEMREIIEAYHAVGAGYFKRLRIIGGATNSDFWNQMQADVYGFPVETMETPEASALGAAILAAVGAGLYGSIQEACGAMAHVQRTYEPNPANVPLYEARFGAYQRCMRDLARETYPYLASLNA